MGYQSLGCVESSVQEGHVDYLIQAVAAVDTAAIVEDSQGEEEAVRCFSQADWPGFCHAEEAS